MFHVKCCQMLFGLSCATSHPKGVDWLLFWPMKRYCKYFLLMYSCFFVREVFDEMIHRPWPALFVRNGSPSASAFHNLGSIILQQPHANGQCSLLCVQLSVKSYMAKVHQELFSMWIVLRDILKIVWSNYKLRIR